MAEELSPELREERERLVEDIHGAFEGVTREGGLTWSEADVIDVWGSGTEQAAARARDRERCWQDLVDDPEWDSEEGAGPGRSTILDSISFRYYLPALMLRSVATRSEHGGLTYRLMWPTDEEVEQARGRSSNPQDYPTRQWSRLGRPAAGVHRQLPEIHGESRAR